MCSKSKFRHGDSYAIRNWMDVLNNLVDLFN